MIHLHLHNLRCIPCWELTKKGVWGCVALKTRFSHLCHVVRKGSHFKQKSLKLSSQDSLLRKKKWNFSLYSLNFYPKFSSQAPKFEKFSSQDPSFRGKNQFASPTLQKSGPHTPTWKKLSVPSPSASLALEMCITAVELFLFLSLFIFFSFHSVMQLCFLCLGRGGEGRGRRERFMFNTKRERVHRFNPFIERKKV